MYLNGIILYQYDWLVELSTQSKLFVIQFVVFSLSIFWKLYKILENRENKLPPEKIDTLDSIEDWVWDENGNNEEVFYFKDGKER